MSTAPCANTFLEEYGNVELYFLHEVYNMTRHCSWLQEGHEEVHF